MRAAALNIPFNFMLRISIVYKLSILKYVLVTTIAVDKINKETMSRGYVGVWEF